MKIGATHMAGLGLMALVAVSSEARAEKRFFTIAAVEPKGGTTTDKEAFPAEAMPTGGGYGLKAPDASGRWEVSTYVWMPSQIVVREGDEVTLDFVGINGAAHPTTIKGLDKTFTLKRGQVMRITFTAEKAGIYPIECAAHPPSMMGEILVLPRS